MEILGRAARVRDIAEGAAWFEEELAEAERIGDLRWQARAQHELGTIDLFDNLRVDRLQAARRLAVENGDPHTIAHADFHLAEALISRGETLMGRIVAERAADLAARIGSPVLPWAWLSAARSHAYDRDDPSLEASVGRARECAGAERHAIEVGVSGRVYALRSLFGADTVAALRHLDDAVAGLTDVPGHHFPHWGLWALLRASTGQLVPGDVDLVSRSAGAGTRFNQALVTAAIAIEKGADRRTQVATTEFARAEQILRGYQHADWMVHLTRWIALPCAARDGWGEHTTWAQEGVRWFAAHQHEPLASACRQFLREIGAMVPRRGRGHSQVPPQLLEMGISSREVDVLGLIAMRLANNEIADRLVLSPRTVERHVSSLLAKTGTRDRGQLAQLAEELQLG
jgi:DNA-binding CsgD family transcriptional regulator